MSSWYEVYDNERVQQDTRRRVSRVFVRLVLGLALAVGGAPLLQAHLGSLPLTASLVSGAGLGVVLWATWSFLRLRCVVWCLKVSAAQIVGYDYARRRTVFEWDDVERLDLDGRGLVIAEAPREGRPARVLRVPYLFPDFSELSHCLAGHAEARGLPICIDGRPWQLLDVRALYPFLAHIAIEEPIRRAPFEDDEGA